MSKSTKNEYEVYVLDMYASDDYWVENERFDLGSLKISRLFNEDPDEADVLSAMSTFTYKEIDGTAHNVLMRNDRNKVYVDDYYGDGTWLEICLKDDHMPIYGLRLKEDETDGQR